MAGKSLTREVVLEALGKVQDPEINKDLVSLGMIEDLEIEGGKVSFTLNLTTPACPLRDEIRNRALGAVEALDGVSEVDIKMGAKVPVGQGRSEHKNIKNVIAVASG
ncbi:MAG: metal-sulfur cluster assembly factor, partial [Anaerolineales bacterium]